MVGHRLPTTECHRLPVVAHHTDVQLIAGGPLATLFASGGPPVVHEWPSVANPTLRLPPACHWWSTSGFFAAHSHWWTTGVMLSGLQCSSIVRGAPRDCPGSHRPTLSDLYPDINVMVGHRWPTTGCHQVPVVGGPPCTDVQLIAGGPL